MSTQHPNETQPQESWLQTALWTGGALLLVAVVGYYMMM